MVKLYDNEDNVCGICYNGKSYYFVKNLQGDVVSLVTKKEVNGEAVYTVVANYTYDAWGKCTIVFDSTAVSIATINPYRYRGYYYDVETGLYYLQSRYYDPEVGRFISGDEAECIKLIHEANSTNLFVYCESNPVNNVDKSGAISWEKILSVFNRIGGVAETLLEYLMDGANWILGIKSKVNWKSISKIAKNAKRSPHRVRQCFNWLEENVRSFKTKTGKIFKALSYILFFSSIASVLKDTTEFVKEISTKIFGKIADGLSALISWGVSKGIKFVSKFVPALGGIAGFILGEIIGRFVDMFFESHSTQIANKYASNVNICKFKLGDYFITFFKSFS